MSKYQALIDALKAGPTEGKWHVEDGHDMPPHRWSVWAACGRFICRFAEMIDGAREQQKADIRYIAAANPATIRSLLADLERAEKALKKMCLSLDLAEDGCKVPTFSAGYENGHGIEVGSLIEQARDEAKAALSQLKGVQ